MNFLLNLMSVGLSSTIMSVQLLVLNTIHKQRFNTMHVCLLYRSNDLEGEKGGTVMCCVDTIVCIPRSMHDRCKHLYLFCFWGLCSWVVVSLSCTCIFFIELGIEISKCNIQSEIESIQKKYIVKVVISTSVGFELF